MLELPTLSFIGATINLPLGQLICSELNLTFPLLLDLPGKWLSDGVYLPASNLCVPPGIPSNLISLVHYTAIDGFAHSTPNHATPSDNIMVQDKFWHGSISRNSSFAPSTKNPVT